MGQPDDPYRVWEFRALKRRSRMQEASELLERVSKQVQPLMRRRRWKVKLLTEFYPRNASLQGLNVNGGAEIKVRLREPGAPDQFYHYHYILGTMLHELVHIEIGPHNAAFYKLLDEITAEVERDMANGLFGTGAGFDARSSGRLGGKGGAGIVPVRNPPKNQLRKTMLAAAEARMKRQQMMPRGPQKLGGTVAATPGLTPSQAAAAAAERRICDDLWCPCGEHFQGLVIDDEPEPEAAVGPQRGDTGEGEASGSRAALPSGPGAPGVRGEGEVIDLTETDDSDAAMEEADAGGAGGSRGGEWGCPRCTLINSASASACGVCGQARPGGVLGVGHAGSSRGHEGGGSANARRKVEWACRFCTLNNSQQETHCGACGQWRYSTGVGPLTTTPRWNIT